jgi:hypothetical protein
VASAFLVQDTTTGKWGLAPATVTFEQEFPTGARNGVNTVFTLTFSPTATKNVWPYINGQLITQDLYSVNLGAKTVTFTTAPAAGQKVYVVYTR